jgi:riboflavin kinase/FMN adenylyltransferase
MNIGVKPTIKLEKETVEVNFFNWSKDLYGETIKVFMLGYIRDEKKFSSLTELEHQIKIDKKTCIGLIEEK